jgi:hypothetical protein
MVGFGSLKSAKICKLRDSRLQINVTKIESKLPGKVCVFSAIGQKPFYVEHSGML